MPKNTRETIDGRNLLKWLRLMRGVSTPTLKGRKPSQIKMYNYFQEQLEILQGKIGGRAKYRLRQEAKGNPYLLGKLKRGECNL